MIKQKPIMYDKKNNEYFYLGNQDCCMCKKKQDGWLVVVYYFGKNKTEGYEYCTGCFQKRKKHKLYFVHLTEQIFFVNSVNYRPKNAIPYIIEYPDVVSGKPRDMYDYWNSRKNSIDERSIDNTKHSGRTELSKLDYNDDSPVIKGVLSDHDKEMNKKDLNFNGILKWQNKEDKESSKSIETAEDVDNYFDEMKKSKPIIVGDNETKRLGKTYRAN